jgi:hypothetical protein
MGIDWDVPKQQYDLGMIWNGPLPALEFCGNVTLLLDTKRGTRYISAMYGWSQLEL